MPGGLSRWEGRGEREASGSAFPGVSRGIKEGPQGALRGRGGISSREEVRQARGIFQGMVSTSLGWLEGRMVFCAQKKPFTGTLKTLRRMCPSAEPVRPLGM